MASVESNLTLGRSATHQVAAAAERLAQEERSAAAQVVVSSVRHTMALIAMAMLPL